MKHIAIITMLLFSTSASAMLNAIEQKVKDTPQMTATCDKKITYLQKMVNKYQLIPINKRTKLVKLKLGYFKAELKNWKGYCADPDNPVSQGN